VSISRRRGSAGIFGDTADIGAFDVQRSINPGPSLPAIINFITANSDAPHTVNVVLGVMHRTAWPSAPGKEAGC